MWLMFGLLEFGLQLLFWRLGWGVLNRGISFGLGLAGIWWWLGVVVMLLVTVKTKFASSRGKELIWAGGLANSLSRFVLGGAFDYIKLGVVGLWFNLADVMMCCGLGLIIWKSKS